VPFNASRNHNSIPDSSHNNNTTGCKASILLTNPFQSGTGIIQGNVRYLHTHTSINPSHCELAAALQCYSVTARRGLGAPIRTNNTHSAARSLNTGGPTPMQQAVTAGPQGDAIDPDAVCIGCGMDSSPDTMVICDSCLQGFHTACFGMLAASTVPDADSVHDGTAQAAQCCISWQWGSRSSQNRPRTCTPVVHQLSPTTHKVLGVCCCR